MKYLIRNFFKRFFREHTLSFFPKIGQEDYLGQKITYDRKTDIGQHFFYFGSFEENELRIIKKYLHTNSIIIDVGANIGLHTIFFSQTAKNGKVFAIEPSKTTFLNLINNVSSNKNVLPLNLALSNVTQWLNFFESSDNAYSGLKDTQRKPVEQTYEVFATTVDRLSACFALPSIDFVKIDVEGTEMDVLEGMQETIDRFHPVIMCEIFKGENSNLFPEATIEFLLKKGYRANNIIGNDLVAFQDYDEANYSFLFLPGQKT